MSPRWSEPPRPVSEPSSLQRLRHPHGDRGAERGRHADEQRGARAGDVGRGEDGREGGDRPVDQADEAGLDDLQQALAVARRAPRRDGGVEAGEHAPSVTAIGIASKKDALTSASADEHRARDRPPDRRAARARAARHEPARRAARGAPRARAPRHRRGARARRRRAAARAGAADGLRGARALRGARPRAPRPGRRGGPLDPRADGHAHLACRRCGAVVDVERPSTPGRHARRAPRRGRASTPARSCCAGCALPARRAAPRASGCRRSPAAAGPRAGARSTLLQREVAAVGVLAPRPRHVLGVGGRLERRGWPSRTSWPAAPRRVTRTSLEARRARGEARAAPPGAKAWTSTKRSSSWSLGRRRRAWPAPARRCARIARAPQRRQARRRAALGVRGEAVAVARGLAGEEHGRRPGAARGGTRRRRCGRSGRWCRTAWPRTRSKDVVLERQRLGVGDAARPTSRPRRAALPRSVASMPGRDVGAGRLAR